MPIGPGESIEIIAATPGTGTPWNLESMSYLKSRKTLKGVNVKSVYDFVLASSSAVDRRPAAEIAVTRK